MHKLLTVVYLGHKDSGATVQTLMDTQPRSFFPLFSYQLKWGSSQLSPCGFENNAQKFRGKCNTAVVARRHPRGTEQLNVLNTRCIPLSCPKLGPSFRSNLGVELMELAS
jgi:hypothetical protein